MSRLPSSPCSATTDMTLIRCECGLAIADDKAGLVIVRLHGREVVIDVSRDTRVSIRCERCHRVTQLRELTWKAR